ncbi:putative monoacyl phosphatidylinositol tetramannoside-binding LpqW domain protein [Mycobacterium xenopi 4042]|uniref:Putative monoacyl phosphatidylinositol tetramannoside-binding LpqW domain protein n=1 Tax=Mycobacterium xenopi 4042 TaxID=1299334 RepID=X8DZX9_MYCXE|nr:putative monoacyl phosphatidylinositol tetramannoside-binding LpqW domain protein [Mycobacterium xenopi 4042]
MEHGDGAADPARHHDRRGRASVQNVNLSGAVPVGIVGDAGQWVKTSQ